MVCGTSCQLSLPVDPRLFLLSDPVNPADSLELLGGVEEGLSENHVIGLHQVEAVSAVTDRHQKHLDVAAVLELLDVPLVLILRGTDALVQGRVGDVILIKSCGQDIEDVRPGGEHQGLGVLVLGSDLH